MKKYIFSIMAGCPQVGDKMLESYLAFHDDPIHVFIFQEDRYDIPLHPSIKNHILPDSMKGAFLSGHAGTAEVLASVIKDNPDSYLIHIDSDIIFKKESLSLIERAGYPDIYGSRRCYKNNPGKAPVQAGVEDAISTYFMGINAKLIGGNIYDNLAKMCQGTFNPFSFPVLDFFDPVFFYLRSKGASVYYESNELIGGQDSHGSKINKFKSNLHFDCGENLIHFGGVGSGYQAFKDDSKMNHDYSSWAKHRSSLFSTIFYPNKETIDVDKYLIENGDTKFDDAGRWVSGYYNEDILNQLKKDLYGE